MTHRDIITITKFKTMGFTDIEMKYIPDIKLNRISCSYQMKVGRKNYKIPFEAFCNPSHKIIISRHFLFEEVIKMLKKFNALDYKEQLSYLEKIGVKE